MMSFRHLQNLLDFEGLSFAARFFLQVKYMLTRRLANASKEGKH
jgi:hypothetical protein